MAIDDRILFAAIRKTVDEGKEWLDLSTLSSTLNDSQIASKAHTEGSMANWAKANPVVRIAKVRISEITQDAFTDREVVSLQNGRLVRWDEKKNRSYVTNELLERKIFTLTKKELDRLGVEPCDECSGMRFPKEFHETHCSLHLANAR